MTICFLQLQLTIIPLNPKVVPGSSDLKQGSWRKCRLTFRLKQTQQRAGASIRSGTVIKILLLSQAGEINRRPPVFPCHKPGCGEVFEQASLHVRDYSENIVGLKKNTQRERDRALQLSWATATEFLVKYFCLELYFKTTDISYLHISQ